MLLRLTIRFREKPYRVRLAFLSFVLWENNGHDHLTSHSADREYPPRFTMDEKKDVKKLVMTNTKRGTRWI